MRKITCNNPICRGSFYFNEQRNPTARLVKCPQCGNVQSLNNPIPPPERVSDDDWSPNPKPEIKRRETDDKIGVLVIYDEYNTKITTFNLRKGINRIGRDSELTDEDVNIRINDSYMSRHHCDIEVRWTGTQRGYEYVLSDKAYLRKAHSSNGTFVNGSNERLRVRDEVLLNDGDTVQVGRTKLILNLIKT